MHTGFLIPSHRYLYPDMSLQELREEIGAVDQEIMQLISRRMDIALRIAESKSETGLPTRDPERVEEVLSAVSRQAVSLGLDPVPVRDIFALLIRMSEDLQDRKRGMV